jgi:uncharacterized repeat protein (TIGR02543 family)
MADKTVTVKPSGQGGTYTNVQAALDGEYALTPNLVTGLAGILYVNIDGTWSSADTARIRPPAFTTDSTHYIVIRAINTAKHQGVKSNSYYRIEYAGDFNGAVVIEVAYTQVIGLQVKNTSTGTECYGISIAAPNCTIRDCIVYGAGSNGFNDRDNYTLIYNSIAHGCTGVGFYKYSGVGANFENCVAINNTGNGFGRSGTFGVTCTNCYAGNNTGGDYAAGPTYTTCYSADGSQSTTAAACSTSSGAQFTNVTAGSENLTIKSGSSLIGGGTNLNTTFTTDIIGTVRGTTWDVGAFEYSSGGSTYSVTYNGNSNTGGSAPTDGNSPYSSGATVTVLANTGSLVRTGYSFTGWNTAANGSGTAYAATGSVTFSMPASAVILYAQWSGSSPVSSMLARFRNA